MGWRNGNVWLAANAYKNNKWIVADPNLLGGKRALRRARLLPLMLECLAHGMALDDTNEAYDHPVPPEALSEVPQVASELTESFPVAV